MKNKKIFLNVLLLFSILAKSFGQVTTLTNNANANAGNYLGTANGYGRVVFKKDGYFSGLINNTSTAFGFQALLNQQGFDYRNVAIGSNSLRDALNSDLCVDNVSVGYNALSNLTTGVFNTFIGSSTGSNLSNFRTSGTWNTAVGYASGGIGGNGNTYIGVGSGGSNLGSGNVFLGFGTGEKNENSVSNIYLGYYAGNNTQNGEDNILLGNYAGSEMVDGKNNIISGSLAGQYFKGGQDNIILGHNSGNKIKGNSNLIIGFSAGAEFSNAGDNNTMLGPQAGQSFGGGSGNVFIGHLQGLTQRNNTIILADGDIQSTQRLYIHNNGYTGIGLGNDVIPQNQLEIKSAFVGSATQSSGIRMTNLKNTINPINNPSLLKDKGVLSVDANGDIILVKDIGGGITNSCLTSNFITKTTGSSGNLTCSSIYDDGLNHVGIFYGSSPFSSVNLSVNGSMSTTGIYNTSDRKFKKEIQPIENALNTIESIDGKTYKWNKESNKEMNFDNANHSGFIAQEIEAVLPHLVITDEKGNKAVNYIELIPYLVEAIKEQQAQISDLKSQISDNFKAQNQDLILFENTKIINISPNPSNDLITISFNVEKSVKDAILQVHDLNGTILSSLMIKDRDNNLTRTLQKDNFGKGIYIVSLVINGKSIDTKKIVFN